MSKLFGVATIKADGRLLRTKTGASLDLGGKTNSPVVGPNGLLGHTTVFKESTLECTIVLGKGESIEWVRNIEDATVEFICDTGQTFIVREGTLADSLKITEGEGGNIPVKMFGQAAEEA